MLGFKSKLPLMRGSPSNPVPQQAARLSASAPIGFLVVEAKSGALPRA